MNRDCAFATTGKAPLADFPRPLYAINVFDPAASYSLTQALEEHLLLDGNVYVLGHGNEAPCYDYMVLGGFLRAPGVVVRDIGGTLLELRLVELRACFHGMIRIHIGPPPPAPDLLRGPPVERETAEHVVDQQRDGLHQGAPQHHERDEGPAQLKGIVVDHRQQRCRSGRRVDSFGQGHDGDGAGACKGSPNPSDRLEIVAQSEELADGSADQRGQDLTQDCITRLGQRRIDRVKF